MGTTLLRRWLDRLRNPDTRSVRTAHRARPRVEALEAREVPAANLVITEVHPSGSGNANGYGADWFEVTNIGDEAADIAGWKVDDSSNAIGSAVALRLVGSIPAGKSAVFFEGLADGSTDKTITTNFNNAWFGGTAPAGFLIGAYGGSGLGLSTSGDGVNLFDAGGTRITGVSFGTASASATFDNLAGNAAVSTTSVAGVNGAFLASAGTETGSPGRVFTGVDLSTYVRVGRYDLPEPTRTTPPDGISLLAQEASGVAYNWDTNTLFIVADGGTSVVQVTKTGQLVDSMTLAPGGSPQGTEFYDPEGITYVGGGKFVMTEERDRQVVLFTYAAGTTLTRAAAQTVDLGTFSPNLGLEGISFDPRATDGSYDPSVSRFLGLKEKEPLGIFQTDIDFANGTATNGSATTENSINLFDPSLLGITDTADIFALSNLSVLRGRSQFDNILILSQEEGVILNVDRSGNILNSLTIVTDPGNPLDVPSQQHEGLTMDGNGFLYVVSENGGGDFDHPQLWVYAPASVPNQAPTVVTLINPVASIDENTSTVVRIKVADVSVADDGLGTNILSVIGPDAAFFDVDSNGLYIKAGTSLDFETQSSYTVAVEVNDPSVGGNPDATSASYTLTLNDIVNEDPSRPALFISEVAPWSSGNSPIGADWFEVTNTGATAVNIAGWKMDDSSNSFASAVALGGITSISPGESVIFIETNDLAGKAALFRSTWFGANPPTGLQIGNYTGGGVGLSTGGDGVTLFNAAGVIQASVSFGASPAGPYPTFNNATALNNQPIGQLSAVGVNGAFAAVNDAAEIGSPGTVGRLFISEVAPWSSGNSPVGADWFEVTNTTAFPVDVTNWRMDDGSGSPAAAVPMSGITTIAPGESVIFIETNDLAGKAALFRSTWFAAYPPANLQIGNYTGGGVGLSTGGDGVYLFNAAGITQTFVTFLASPGSAPFGTFDNAAALRGVPISQLSADGVNGAFAAVNDIDEIGSPGTIRNRPPVANTDNVTTAEDTSITFNVLANDTDPDGDVRTLLSFTAPANGTLVDNGSGSFTYTPAGDFSGADRFTYTFGDGNGRIAVGTVNIAVSAVNDPPVVTVPGSQTTIEDLAVTFGGIAVEDGDVAEGSGVLRVTLSVPVGRVTVQAGVAGGLTAGQITGNGTAAVVLEGSVTAVNATLSAGVAYLGAINFSGTVPLTVLANDLGNTGAGGPLEDAGSISIQVLSTTQQIVQLRDMVLALEHQGAINRVQANSLVVKLDNALKQIDKAKPKVAFNAIGAFINEVEAMLRSRRLTQAQGEPILTAAWLLQQSLEIGGGF
jgi:uncharacterized protein YjiK